MSDNEPGKKSYGKLFIGLGCIALYILLVSLPTPAGLPVTGQRALALMVAVIVAWIFEVVPIGMASALAIMLLPALGIVSMNAVSYTHLRAHETRHDLVCRLLLEKKK